MDAQFRIAKLVDRIKLLNSLQLGEVERFVASLTGQTATQALIDSATELLEKDWPHAPIHRLTGKGTFIVTAGTLNKQHFFRTSERLDFLEAELLKKAQQYQWQIEAWAVFSNHYHFVAHAMDDAKTLKQLIAHLHADTARVINREDNAMERAVWFNFWETELTFEKSYLSRLKYVHQNAVKHGLVSIANQYRWCSAGWFERTASPAQIRTIYSFKTDKVKVVDDFDVLPVE